MSIRELLNEEVPANLVEKRVMYHDRRIGRDVEADYISGGSAILLLNDTLGNENWSSSIKEFRQEYMDIGGKDYIVYICIMELAAKINGETVTKSDVGTFVVERNRKGAANTLEAAIKGSSTDALKRCARQIGQRLGNSLYTDDDAVAGYFGEGGEAEVTPVGKEKLDELMKLIEERKGKEAASFCERVKGRLGISDMSEISEEHADKLIKTLKKK